MAVQNEIPSNTFQANNDTVFLVDFYVYGGDNLLITLDDNVVNSNEYIVERNTEENDEGATITFYSPITGTLVIARNTSLERISEYNNTLNNITASTLNNDFDRIYRIQQEQKLATDLVDAKANKEIQDRYDADMDLRGYVASLSLGIEQVDIKLPLLSDVDVGVDSKGKFLTEVESPLGAPDRAFAFVDLALDKEDVNLGNVDNISDLDKPISTLVQAELDGLIAEDVALNEAVNALANGSTKAYLTYAELDAAKLTLPINSFARVTNDPTPENNWIWQWDGVNLTKSNRDDLAVSLEAVATEVANRTALIKAGDDVLVDKYGFVLAEIVQQGLKVLLPLISDKLVLNNDAGSLIASFTETVSQLSGLSVTTDGSGVYIKDSNGFLLAALDSDGVQVFGHKIDLGGLKLVDDGNSINIKDSNGFILTSFLSNALAIYLSRIDFGNMSVLENGSGLVIQDKSGFNFDLFALLTNLSDANEEEPVSSVVDCSKPLFSNKLAAWENDIVTIDTACILDNRILQRTNQHVVMSVSSQIKPYSVVADDILTIQKFSDIGTSAYLTLRDKRVSNTRTRLFMTCVAVPNSVQSVSVHMIGDSIGNRGGGALLKEYLLAHSYTSSFIGTMRGDSRDGLNGEGGELGECREGWKATDFTYAVTTRIPVAVGDEAAYLAASKGVKAGQCPYLRIATGGDNPAFVKNGYIFDFAFYLSRFSLATPQVVTIGLGTNDVAALANPALATAFYDNMTIMISQIRAAVTNVPIVIYIPSTPHEAAREQLWTDKYTVVIRELQKLAKDLDVILAPTWAMVTGEYGYSMSIASTDSVSGAETGGFADRVHPTRTPRYQLYNTLSAYVAAAKSNLF